VASDIFTLFGSSTFPALIGMAIYSAKIKPGGHKLPKLMNGGLALFAQVWAVAFITALASSALLFASGVSESGTSAFGKLVIPSVVAFYFTRFRHSSSAP